MPWDILLLKTYSLFTCNSNLIRQRIFLFATSVSSGKWLQDDSVYIHPVGTPRVWRTGQLTWELWPRTGSKVERTEGEPVSGWAPGGCQVRVRPIFIARNPPLPPL